MHPLHTFHTIPRTLAALILLALMACGLVPSSSTAVTAASPYRIDPATFLGGGSGDYGRNIGLDAQGNIYLASDTFSSSILGHPIDRGGANIVVAKLNPTATMLLGFFAIGGSAGDHVGGMAVTPQGEVVLAVATDSPDFPTKNALYTALDQENPGALLKINAALDDLVFSTFTDFTVSSELHTVAVDGAGTISIAGFVYNPVGPKRDLILERFSPDGQQQLYRNVWDGDDEHEIAQQLAVLPDGTTYIAGYTEGRWGGLAVTENAFQPICGRRLALGEDRDCDDDAFVMRLTPDGTLDYATYLGGNGNDRAVGMAVDAQGAIYLLGDTTAQDFPTTPDAHQPHCRVAKSEDGCYYDMFVTKLAPDGSHLVYSTYLASGDLSGLDYPVAITVDQAGNATVVGFTASEQWPVKDAFQSALNAAPCPNIFQDRFCFDSVVTSFTPEGQLAFSSYLGGKHDEYSADVVLGADGSIFVTGSTESLDFPATPGTVQPAPRSGSEIFMARITTQGGSGGSGSYNVYLPIVVR